jgi:hypothetical protein
MFIGNFPKYTRSITRNISFACYLTILSFLRNFVGTVCLLSYHTVVPMGLVMEKDFILESPNQMNSGIGFRAGFHFGITQTEESRRDDSMVGKQANRTNKVP